MLDLLISWSLWITCWWLLIINILQVCRDFWQNIYQWHFPSHNKKKNFFIGNSQYCFLCFSIHFTGDAGHHEVHLWHDGEIHVPHHAGRCPKRTCGELLPGQTKPCFLSPSFNDCLKAEKYWWHQYCFGENNDAVSQINVWLLYFHFRKWTGIKMGWSP